MWPREIHHSNTKPQAEGQTGRRLAGRITFQGHSDCRHIVTDTCSSITFQEHSDCRHIVTDTCSSITFQGHRACRHIVTGTCSSITFQGHSYCRHIITGTCSSQGSLLQPTSVWTHVAASTCWSMDTSVTQGHLAQDTIILGHNVLEHITSSRLYCPRHSVRGHIIKYRSEDTYGSKDTYRSEDTIDQRTHRGQRHISVKGHVLV